MAQELGEKLVLNRKKIPTRESAWIAIPHTITVLVEVSFTSGAAKRPETREAKPVQHVTSPACKALIPRTFCKNWGRMKRMPIRPVLNTTCTATERENVWIWKTFRSIM